jgi:hypothetical protein
MGNTSSYHGRPAATAGGVVAGSQEARATLIGSLFSSCFGPKAAKATAPSSRREGPTRGVAPRLADGSKLERRLVGRFTEPTGLYARELWDERKVRRLILRYRLAPRFPGAEFPVRVSTKDGNKSVSLEGKGFFPEYIYQEYVSALEECPICFLYYPCLNTTSCCQRGICTECFLQLRPQRFVARVPASSCPFCKHELMEVVFRGSRPEKEIDEMCQEEDRVKEAMEQARIRQEAEAKEERLRMKRMRIEKCMSTLRAVVAAAARERIAEWLNFGEDSASRGNASQSGSDWRSSLAEPGDDLYELMNISAARKKAWLSIRRSNSSPMLLSRPEGLVEGEARNLHSSLNEFVSVRAERSNIASSMDTTALAKQPAYEIAEPIRTLHDHPEKMTWLLKTEYDLHTGAEKSTTPADVLGEPTPLGENLIDFESPPNSPGSRDRDRLQRPSMTQKAPLEQSSLYRRRSARCASVSSSTELLLTVNFMRSDVSVCQKSNSNHASDQVQSPELPASAFLRRRPGSRREFYSAWEREELALLHDMEARGLLDWVEEADITYEELLLIEAIRRSLLSNP